MIKRIATDRLATIFHHLPHTSRLSSTAGRSENDLSRISTAGRTIDMSCLTSIMLAAVLCLTGCKSQSDKYLDFLYESMPLPDRMVRTQEWWRTNVEKTLEVRGRMDWDIPEREFRHFVLPLRVNNEALDDFRLVYADSLCERVKGLSMADAALEINHWCHERATYHASDARTSSPMATIRSGLGRCGEESVLTVSAMRAAGIPSRQVYTPRWAHTDDNHAWVEVYVDGGWHFLGACEPDPALDMGWFNGPVSRAILLHTKAFGDYRSDEDVISRTRTYTEVNVIGGYVPVRRTTVTVVDRDGQPMEGANVEFKIYNYAEYYTVAKYQSGADGRVALNTGYGDIMVWASKGEEFGLAKGSSEEVQVVLDHHIGEEFALDFDIVPPAEDPIPTNATEEQIAANSLRLKAEDEFRSLLPHGNTAVTDAFVQAHGESANTILNSLSLKDMNDVTSEVLEDAWNHRETFHDGFKTNRDCPRVELEMLYPYFEEIRSGVETLIKNGCPTETFANPQAVWTWVSGNITVDDESNPQRLRIPPVFVWREKVADTRSRDIFYVAMCRSLGFEARLDELTLKAQYLSKEGWIDVQTASPAPQGGLSLSYARGDIQDPEYYTHFTLSKISDGSATLLTFNEEGPLNYSSIFSEVQSLDEGYYMLTTGRRLADGSVLSKASFFTIDEDSESTETLEIRSNDTNLSVLGHFDAEQHFMPSGSDKETSLLSATGRGYFVVAVLAPAGDEPSNHARQQLGAAASELDSWGRPVVILSSDGSEPAVIDGFEHAVYGSDIDGAVARMLREGACRSDARLPIVIVGDSFGRIVYFSQGYNTSLAEDIRSVLPRL